MANVLRGKNTINLSKEERTEWQKKPIKQVDRLLSLKEAAEIAGVSYPAARGYAVSDDPKHKMLKSCMRFPDQTGFGRMLWSHDTPRILKQIRDKGIKERGPKRGTKLPKWSKERKEKMKKLKKARGSDMKAAKSRAKLRREGKFKPRGLNLTKIFEDD
jgi:hypothetical protein